MLTLTPALRCKGGVAQSNDEIMFYYYVPRCAVIGHVVIGGTSRRVLEGLAWYDHEFGGLPAQKPDPRSQVVRKRH
jgi:predicted secreted hydrolase